MLVELGEVRLRGVLEVQLDLDLPVGLGQVVEVAEGADILGVEVGPVAGAGAARVTIHQTVLY